MNLPNRLSLTRFVFAIVFVALLSFPSVPTLALGWVVFVIGATTDFVDGKIARARNLVTTFGKLIDPLADKVLVSAAFIMMLHLPDLRIPAWTVVAIIGREFLITGLRALAAGEGMVIAASQTGKLKTVLQMGYATVFLALAVLLEAARAYPAVAAALPGGAETFTYYAGMVSAGAIVVVAAYTVYSGWGYTRDNWHVLGMDNA